MGPTVLSKIPTTIRKQFVNCLTNSYLSILLGGQKENCISSHLMTPLFSPAKEIMVIKIIKKCILTYQYQPNLSRRHIGLSLQVPSLGGLCPLRTPFFRGYPHTPSSSLQKIIVIKRFNKSILPYEKWSNLSEGHRCP